MAAPWVCATMFLIGRIRRQNGFIRGKKARIGSFRDTIPKFNMAATGAVASIGRFAGPSRKASLGSDCFP